jgi:NADPH2:quinone reductase
MATVKALLSQTTGGPETLAIGCLPDPVPGDDGILISVKACGANFPDTLIIEDKYQFRPERPFSPGGEVAGIVAEVGHNVSDIRPGDRVAGWCCWGGMAEKVVVTRAHCIPIPDAMPFDEAAAFILTYGTSHYALKQRGHLKPGETLLVIGAAGGAGLAAVELGKAMGAHVVAAVSSDEKLALATSHGAASGVVYPRGPFDKASLRNLSGLFKQACPENGADVIYDAVGGDYAEAALRSIAWEGRFLVVGFPAGIPRLPLNLALLKSCQIVGVFWAAWMDRDPIGFQTSAHELLELYQQGAIRPTISARYPLEQGADAIASLAARAAMGKLVVTIE